MDGRSRGSARLQRLAADIDAGTSVERLPAPADGLAAGLAAAGTALTRGTRAGGFWLAVLLPAVYLPLLTVGLDATPLTAAFVALLGLHALAIVAGAAHEP